MRTRLIRCFDCGRIFFDDLLGCPGCALPTAIIRKETDMTNLEGTLEAFGDKYGKLSFALSALNTILLIWLLLR